MTSPPFSHRLALAPLGLLYGSAGRFLSPENLVGRSGAQFPPSAATLSGLFAAALGNDRVQSLQLAGPFWAFSHQADLFVPTPATYLTQLNPEPDGDGLLQGQVKHRLVWHPPTAAQDYGRWLYFGLPPEGEAPDDDTPAWRSPNDKFAAGTWLSLAEWDDPRTVYANPWTFLPHLHPRLKADERHVADNAPGGDGQGSLFLENAVQLHPQVQLVYLANQPLDDGWYRFGGEGHMVDLTCTAIEPTSTLGQVLRQPLTRSFALITPAVWGSNRLSLRYPTAWPEPEALLTRRPVPFRHRLGSQPGQTKRLSRGRYAVPSGTVYVMPRPFDPWHHWPEDWFAVESRPDADQGRTGFTTKRWGCGLALPLPEACNLEAVPAASQPAVQAQ